MTDNEIIGLYFARDERAIAETSTKYGAYCYTIAHRILEQGEAAVKPYLEFLKSGCTQDPVSLLKIAGVDLSTSKPVDEALEVFERVVAEMEELQKDKT